MEKPTLTQVLSLWRSGLLDGALSILREPWTPTRPQSLDDETVGSFVSRRSDKRFANNVTSAVFHGIYAGDIWQLSAKTLLSRAWYLESMFGSVLGGFFRMHNDTPAQSVTLVHPYDVEVTQALYEETDLDLDFARKLKDASMFTFKDGLQHLVRALQKSVEQNGNVEIRTETPIQSFKPVEEGMGVEIVSGVCLLFLCTALTNFEQGDSSTTETFDLAISTLRNDKLTPYVTVMTVNLYFANPNLLPVEGFGYLIPQTVPFEQNPERALGVIFDSSAVKGQDNAEGTKITVMMGGHWWNDWAEFPSEEEGLEMAKSVIKRHMGITDEPIAQSANLSKDCIPQYTLGYDDRLRDFSQGMSAEFKGRLRVVGSQFNGVGVNDCIAGAWNVTRGLRGDGWKSTSCGLDKIVDSRQYTVVPSNKMKYIKNDYSS